MVGLADELRARGVEVLEASSFEDGLATVVSDSGIHCVFLNWTLGATDTTNGSGTRHAHVQATELLRALRSRNAKVPIFLMADRKLAGTVTVEVATLADEFVWLLDDTAVFIAGRVLAAMERYLEGLLPPFAAALARTNGTANIRGRPLVTRAASRSSSRRSVGPSSTSTARTSSAPTWGSSAARSALLLGHSGPIGESERYAARVFGAHRSYSVLNGTSASNRAIMSACVGDAEIALCDRNCHKSIEQALVLTGGIPVFLSPTRNRYGIIGPIPP